MAEELTRSLTTLAERGTPRGAPGVLEGARRDAARLPDPQRRWVVRPAWAAATAFVATLVVLGGSLALGSAMRQPGRDVGSAWVTRAGRNAAGVTGWWLLIPAIALMVAVAAALIVRNHQGRTGKDRGMATTIETAPAERVEIPEHNNRWLVVTVILLAVALVALGAWVLFDQASEPATAATDEINTLYDDYLNSWMEGDRAAFFAVTTEDYTLHSFGEVMTRDQQVGAITSVSGVRVERVGDLYVMGEGPEYFVGAAEQVEFGGRDYSGVSAYRVIETDDGLKIVEHNWVGDL